MMVNSAGMSVAPVDSPDQLVPAVTAESIIMSRSTLYMGLAIAGMWLGAMLPVRRLVVAAAEAGKQSGQTLHVLTLATLVVIFTCALVYIPGISREVNGANRWIGLPIPGIGDALSVQPSEIAKWAFVGIIAWYGASRIKVIHEFWRGLCPALIAIAAVSGFIVLEDLGTGVLIAAVACLLLLGAGARVWQFAMFVPVGLLALAGAILTSEYRVKRVMAFMDPYADPQGIGYHTIQSLVAVAGGKGFGRGLGHGLQKFGYLPEDRTDFLFAIICEELGIAGAAVVMTLFIAMVWAGFLIMRREVHPILRLLTLGIIATVGLQAAMNLAVVTGMAPTKGIALPLLSSGGTGWILTAFSMGLLIAIDRSHAAEESPAADGLQVASV